MRLTVLVLAAILSVTAAGQQQVYDPGNGVTLPVVVKEVKPSYTPAAKAKKVQGSVLLRAVVTPEGYVGDAEVVQSLDADLDQQAMAALKQWEFKPGTRESKPVAVRVVCELRFTLR